MANTDRRTAIIFDVDDTLYKEHYYRLSGYRTIARHFAAICGLTPARLYQLMAENPAEAFENVRDLAATRGIDVPVELQLAIYRSHRPDILLNAETIDTLRTLRERGYLLGAITDGRVYGQLNKIAALELERWLDPELIIATVLLDTDKNSRKPFEEMERLVGSDVHLVYVGDNPQKDFRHPNALGWQTIMLTDDTGLNVHPQRLADWPESHHPQSKITSISQLKQIFR